MSSPFHTDSSSPHFLAPRDPKGVGLEPNDPLLAAHLDETHKRIQSMLRKQATLALQVQANPSVENCTAFRHVSHSLARLVAETHLHAARIRKEPA